MATLFSLFVGINKYDPKSTVNINELTGCSNDIGQLQAFLETVFPKNRREMVTLINEKATYQEVIRAFGKDHLLRAKKDDVVLISYSGHGSRELAAPEWSKYYGEGKEETWVCYDSRTATGLDLADKELAFLIEPLAKRGAQVVVIMDCCHSGSGTRFIEDIVLGAARQQSDRKQPRLWESYLNGAIARRFPKGKDIYLPNSRHILLAACDRKEKAWEIMTQQGLFSSQYLKILEETGGKISYSDLFIRCRSEMMKITDNQHPQFEPCGYFNAYNGFLGLADAQSGATSKIYFMGNRWMVTQGVIHHLPTEHPSVFDVLQDDQLLGRAVTTAVGLEESGVRLENFEGDAASNYTARLTSLPVPPLIFNLQGDVVPKKEMVTALSQFKPLYFTFQEQAVQAPYSVKIQDNAIQIIRNIDGLMIREANGNNQPAMLNDIFQAAEHLARWEKAMILENAKTQIKGADIELILIILDDQGQEIWSTTQPEVMLEIVQQQKWRFRVEARNNHAFQTYYCALFYASSSYGLMATGFNEPILPKKAAIVWDRTPNGDPLTFQLNGKNSALDVLKLFVSQEKATFANIAINALTVGKVMTFSRDRSDGLGRTKDIGGGGLDLGEEGVFNDWRTLQLKVRSVAHYPGVGPAPVTLAGGKIMVQPHPTFRASAAWVSPGAAGRYIEPAAILVQYAAQNNLKILQFAPPTAAESPLSVLMLSRIERGADLEAIPLKIQLDTPATMGKNWKIVTWDGNKIQVAGTVKTENGVVIAAIHQLWVKKDERQQGNSDFAQLIICEVSQI